MTFHNSEQLSQIALSAAVRQLVDNSLVTFEVIRCQAEAIRLAGNNPGWRMTSDQIRRRLQYAAAAFGAPMQV